MEQILQKERHLPIGSSSPLETYEERLVSAMETMLIRTIEMSVDSGDLDDLE